MPIDIDQMVKVVARAICASTGRDPDAPFRDRHGRPLDFPEWHRWQAEARAAIRAMHDHLIAAHAYSDDCQECGVGQMLTAALSKAPDTPKARLWFKTGSE